MTVSDLWHRCQRPLDLLLGIYEVSQRTGLICILGAHVKIAVTENPEAARLLLVAHVHHVDLAFHIEEVVGHRNRATSLARACLGGNSHDALLLVGPSLLLI